MQTALATNALYRDKRRRVWELDFLRGVAVIAMLFDHLMCDFSILHTWFYNFSEINNGFINYMHELAMKYWVSDFRFYAHPIFVFLFLFLVGTSCAFSRDNVRRGAGLGVFALAFTGVTFVLREFGIMKDGIVFGILDCIALCILCASATDIASKPNRHINKYLPLVLGVVILAFGIAFEFWDNHDLWDRNGFVSEHMIDYIIGTRAYGDDWFGLFPWVGMVLVGMYWGKAAYSMRVSLLPKLEGKWNKPFTFVGRHALLFYIVHQVVLSGIVMLICACFGYRMF